MAGNAGADRVQVAIDLGIVGRFIAREISPQKESCHQQHNGSNDYGYTEPRIAGRQSPPAKVSLRGRQGSAPPDLIGRPLVYWGLSRALHVTCSSGIALHPLPRSRSTAPAPL